jgi:hypothetical protein
MKLVKRYDYQSGGSSKVEMTPEGFMHVQARASRVGVFKYRQMDGSVIRELRPKDEVFKAESMATLAMKPITNNHPSGLLDSENATLYQVGFTGESVKKVDDKFIEISTVITDRRTIADAEGGKVEVSPGYVCELDFTPGVFDGEEYDAVQRNIRYNHLALVGKGRQGPEVRLRLDADDAVQVELNQPKETKTVKIKLDGKDFEVSDEAGAAFGAEMKKKQEECDKKDADRKAAEDALVEAKKDGEKMAAKADGLESEVKKLKTAPAPKLDSADLREAVKARIGLEKIAAAAGVEKFDAMDDLALKKAVILADSPETKLDGKSDEYINARFDVAAESISASDATAKKIGENLNSRKPVEVADADDARQKMIKRQQSAWKGEKKEENK